MITPGTQPSIRRHVVQHGRARKRAEWRQPGPDEDACDAIYVTCAGWAGPQGQSGSVVAAWGRASGTAEGFLLGSEGSATPVATLVQFLQRTKLPRNSTLYTDGLCAL